VSAPSVLPMGLSLSLLSVDRVCPLLGLAADRRVAVDGVDAAHRCYAEQPAAALDPELLTEERAGFLGRRVGPYVIVSELGRGGMGIVFCAEDTRLGRSVALKAIAPDLASHERMRDRLRREARAAAALSHPAIATVYALEESDGDLFIASELVEGRTLREEVAGPRPSPAALMDTARAIAGALAAAHAHGIVHRDLKPENVVRRADGQVKVLDFGLARALAPSAAPADRRLTLTGTVLGTPGYMAPEQLRGGPTDARVDIYAFGVLMYELATGRHPLEESARQTVTPPQLDAVVRRCLSAEPQDRFPSGIELLAALTPTGEVPIAPVTASAAVGWWQFHQLAVAILHSAMVVALWFARVDFPAPWGTMVFYAGLAAATAGVTMRLHLWFTSRYHPDQLSLQLARVRPTLFAVDLGYQILLLGAGVRGALTDAPTAPLFFIVAIASILGLLLIEPATSRAAFSNSNS